MLFVLPVLIMGIVTVLTFTYMDSKVREVIPDTLFCQEITMAAGPGQPEPEDMVKGAEPEKEEDG